MSKVITQAGVKPKICYGYDVPPHMFQSFLQRVEVSVHHGLQAQFDQEKAKGHCTPWETPLYSTDCNSAARALIRGGEVLHDIPVGEYRDPKLLAFIKRRVDAQVRKRFAGLTEEKFDRGSEKWPGRCFHLKETFYDERLGQLRLLRLPRKPDGKPALGERGARLTVQIGRELYRKSRQPRLEELYTRLHHRSVSEELAAGMAASILEELLRKIPDLCHATETSTELRQRLLEAILQRGGVGFDGSRPTHYRGTLFLARRLAAIIIGSPSDNEKTVRDREELLARRMELRDGHIRLFAHAPRQVR